jgi:hypothetical protein
VQPPGVLLKGPSPGYRHDQEQRVQSCIIESLANAVAGGDHDARRVGL